MWSVTAATVTAFGVVFVAELGDKTQLLALGYGARHRLRTVALGLLIGYGVASALAAVVGGLLGATLPERPIGLAAGVLFLVFAVLAWRDVADDEGNGDDPATPDRRRAARGVVISIAVAIAVAELGDKTQLATAALAARSNPVATWVGATAGEVAAGVLGAVAGRQLGRRVSARSLQLASAVLFAVFGVALIVVAW